MSALAERLGHDADARILIISCDDLGSSQAANAAVYDALRAGVASTAGLMVPCPWAREAAARYRGEDVGVQLTLNAEYDLYRWGPLTIAPSLLDGDGGFPRTPEDLWDHADLDEARRELRAQVERAILWGFDVTHLTTHLGTLRQRPEFFDLYLEAALEFRLPIRLSDAATQRSIGFPFRDLAVEEGVVFPDHLVILPSGSTMAVVEQALTDLQPGVTEVVVRPAMDTPELRGFCPRWADRVAEHHLVAEDPDLPALLDRLGIEVVGYRVLRDLQHREA